MTREEPGDEGGGWRGVIHLMDSWALSVPPSAGGQHRGGEAMLRPPYMLWSSSSDGLLGTKLSPSGRRAAPLGRGAVEASAHGVEQFI